MLAFLSPSLSVRSAVRISNSAKAVDRPFLQKPEFVRGAEQRYFDFFEKLC
jgi:hypothetical protein